MVFRLKRNLILVFSFSLIENYQVKKEKMEILGIRVEKNSFPLNFGEKCLQRDEQLFSPLVFFFKTLSNQTTKNGEKQFARKHFPPK